MSHGTPFSSSQTITNIYHICLLRHGESEANTRGVIQGQTDSPLSARGRQQADLLRQRWLTEKKSFDLIISSPLSRAHHTAKTIADGLKILLEVDAQWFERDFGRLAGLSPQEIMARGLLPDFQNPFRPLGETGESVMDLFLRAGSAVRDLVSRPAGRYLVVSHGGILTMGLFAILGITPQPNMIGPRFQFDNAAFATLTYTPQKHEWRVLGINDRRHLEEV